MKLRRMFGKIMRLLCLLHSFPRDSKIYNTNCETHNILYKRNTIFFSTKYTEFTKYFKIFYRRYSIYRIS